MARKPSPRKPEQAELDEFAERYETFASIYRDPIEVIFEVMSTTESDETKLRAAEVLMSFRFPKLKALENKNPDTGKTVNFTINLTQPKQEQPPIDITPPSLKLVSPK